MGIGMMAQNSKFIKRLDIVVNGKLPDGKNVKVRFYMVVEKEGRRFAAYSAKIGRNYVSADVDENGKAFDLRNGDILPLSGLYQVVIDSVWSKAEKLI